MKISGTTRVFLIVGDPVAQVRAPEAFNHLFQQHGVDAVLVPAQIPAAELEGFVRHVFKAGNIDGLWVAIPHKTGITAVLDKCDPLGRAAGAVNAVRRNADGTIEGALFDGVGFTKALGTFNVPVKGRNVLVVGVGGGGVAIAASLAQQGAGRVALFDNTPGRTDEVAARLRAEFGVDVVSAKTADPAGYDLVAHATPLGLKIGDPLPFDVSRVDADATVVDILMKNQPTPLVRACRERGVDAHPGFEMMVQQVPEYLSFFGFDHIAKTVQADPADVRALFTQA